MKVTRNFGLAVIGIVLGVLLLRTPVCNSVFQHERGAVLSSGKHVAGGDLKTPLIANVLVYQRGSRVIFTFRLQDAEGAGIRSLRLPSGRLKPPKFKVYDSNGRQVHAGAMEYG